MNHKMSVIKGTYKCNTFFHIFAFFLILTNQFNKNNNLLFFVETDFADSKREKKVPFFSDISYAKFPQT